MEKLCVFCEHFDWEGVSYRHYSTLTGGSTKGGAACKKWHYYEERPDDEKELRELFLKAETCPDYTPPNVVCNESHDYETVERNEDPS